jgi:hypothetical protein
MIEIKKWFEKNGKVEFILPDGFYGRPGDCWYLLDKIYIEDSQLFLEFSNEKKLTFHGEITYHFVNNCLEITNFDLFVFKWQETISDNIEWLIPKQTFQIITEPNVYHEGAVRFIPCSSFFNSVH